MNDAQLARDIATEAGALLHRLQHAGRLAGRELGDEGDREANALILDRLRAARPDAFVLSEESADDKARCAAAQTWIVDRVVGMWSPVI